MLGDNGWYTALVNLQCDSVTAPGASDPLGKLVAGVQAACKAVTGAGASTAEDWSMANQVYDQLKSMPMQCEEETLALDLLGRLVQAHREDPEAQIEIVRPSLGPSPGQQSGCS
jgi:hypothetical protein